MRNIAQDLKNFPGRFNPKLLISKKKLSVFVSVCSRGSVSAETMIGLMGLLACPDIHFYLGVEKGDSLISRSRAVAATKFLKSNCDILLFIDDDMSFDPLLAMKLSARMIQGDLDILSGAYVVKSENNPFIQIKTFKDQEITLSEDAQPVEIMLAGTGFLAIRRRVFESMLERLNLPFCMPNGFYPFFETMQKEVEGEWRYLGEDWAFCERARELGFKVHLDPSIWIGHVGKYIYTPADLCREKRREVQNIRYREA